MRKGFRGWMVNGLPVVGKRGGWQRWLPWRNSWPKLELKAYMSLLTVLPVWRHKCEMRLKDRVGFLDGEEALSRSWGSVALFVVTGSWGKFSYCFSGVFVGGGGGSGGLLTFFSSLRQASKTWQNTGKHFVCWFAYIHLYRCSRTIPPGSPAGLAYPVPRSVPPRFIPRLTEFESYNSP